MTIVMSLETSAVQLIGWVPVSNLLNQSLWSSYDHHRHAINFQEQGNGCHLIKMMSTMGYLFFFSEANVRTIWYLFVAFACRNWEFFLLSSIWTIIFLQKQFIWYDVKNLKPRTHYKDLCCLCHWNLKAINAKWAIFDMKDYNYSLFYR